MQGGDGVGHRTARTIRAVGALFSTTTISRAADAARCCNLLMNACARGVRCTATATGPNTPSIPHHSLSMLGSERGLHVGAVSIRLRFFITPINFD